MEDTNERAATTYVLLVYTHSSRLHLKPGWQNTHKAKSLAAFPSVMRLDVLSSKKKSRMRESMSGNNIWI